MAKNEILSAPKPKPTLELTLKKKPTLELTEKPRPVLEIRKKQIEAIPIGGYNSNHLA